MLFNLWKSILQVPAKKKHKEVLPCFSTPCCTVIWAIKE